MLREAELTALQRRRGACAEMPIRAHTRQKEAPRLSMLAAVWSNLYGACLGAQSALGNRVYSSSISEAVVCELRLGYWWSMTIPRM
jgi:hypothetical protein